MKRYLSWLSFLLGLLSVTAQAADLSVTFASVGQGDAALIISPTGKTVLIDGGPPEGSERLLQVLQKRKVSSIDLVVLTHPHLDHLGGLAPVVRSIPVRMFLDAGFPSTSPPYTSLLQLLSERGVAVKNATMGRNIDLGDGATLTLLGPPSPFLTNTRSDVNANSVVVRLHWRGRTALFTGDSEPEAERAMLDRNAETPELLRAELLKVAHHGGRYSSTAPFLRMVAPRLAVISVGLGNDYGHPTAEAMSRIQSAGATIYRTDQQGDVTVQSRDGQPWQVTTEAAQPVLKAAHGAGSTSLAPSPPKPVPQTEPSLHGPLPVPAAPNTGPPASRESGFAASVNSKVFHRLSCPSVARIYPANRISFANRAAASQSGREPAGDCQP